MSVELDGRDYGCEFHHVQMYVDKLQSLEVYKAIENKLNDLAHKGSFDPFSGGMRFLGADALPARVKEGREIWKELCKCQDKVTVLDEADFVSHGQDIVEQLIIGLGWRVTAEYTGKATRSVLITSQDAKGVKMVVTARLDGASEADSEVYDHFDCKHFERSIKSHNGFQAIGVLGFDLPEEGAFEATVARYQKLHPSLLLGTHVYEDTRTVQNGDGTTRTIVLGTMKVLEAFAYYKTDKNGGEVDQGTVLRFVHREGSFGSKEGFGNPQGVLPGLEDVPALFDGTSIPAYADHWVSNVTDRHSFLDTLQDVLGFTPKVDFNAGVVAAGRAKIESTVTGNNTAKIKATCDSEEILKDQSQIYLPINNALSDVGHVHFFLQEVGQGVQHLASRVKDLVSFIERVNNYRKITGRGFSFLRIPRSYYGRLAIEDLVSALEGDSDRAEKIMLAAISAGFCTVAGIVDLEVTDEIIRPALVASGVTITPTEEDAVIHTIKRSRYINLYKLLSDHLSEETYLKVITNMVLVDLQGQDVLFQIFTCNILQREAGSEAPFLEFIQRVCSEKRLPDGSCAPIKPGCGGFGIRNFLTLFLSIEVSKAMADVEAAVVAGDSNAEARARGRVELFTKQLEESNPILTAIADAMTLEGDALEELKSLREANSTDADLIARLEKVAKEQGDLKLKGNTDLQALSERYSKLMEQYS